MWFIPKPIKYTGPVRFLLDVPISWEPRAGDAGFYRIGQYGADSWKWKDLLAHVRKMYPDNCFWCRSFKSKDGHFTLTIYTKHRHRNKRRNNESLDKR